MNFLAKKRARKSPIFVVVQMVLLRDNMSEVAAYRKLWDIEGVDEVRFKRDEVQIEGSRSEDSHLEGQRRNPCHLLWRGPLYVRYDGKAFPCCYLYDEEPVGDLNEQSVMEVWNSPAMVKLRQAHVDGDLEDYPLCQTCQASRPELPAFYGSLMVDGLTVRKAVPVLEKLSRFYRFGGIFEKKQPSGLAD